MRIALFIMASVFAFNSPVKAQDNSLSLVSSSKRSDGKGEVIRFHLSTFVDSFRVNHPDLSLIQLTLFDQKIDTTSIKTLNNGSAIRSMNFYHLPQGIGVDIYLNSNSYFKVKAYPDAKSEDLLLALTKTTQKKLTSITNKEDPIIWSSYSLTASDVLGSDVSVDSTINQIYNRAKEKAKFDVVVLDAGHGGHDTGAIGYKHVLEKNVVLKVVKKIGGYINKYLPDVKVVYTRNHDNFVKLKERGRIANRNEGDLFVSIHCNASRYKSPHGTEVYFLGHGKSKAALNVLKRENKVVRVGKENKQKKLSDKQLLIYEMTNSGYINSSQKLAAMIDHQLDDRAQRHSRGVKQAAFVVLYHASMPAVLVETGFITNPAEARYLTSNYGQTIIASAIFRAIRNYKRRYEKSQHFKAE